MKRIIAQIRKELTQFSRDKLTVVLALVLPLITMWLLGSAVSLTVTDLPVVIQDWDQSASSRRYYDTIKQSLTFHVVDLPINESPEKALDKAQARAAIIIPPKFERDLQRGQSVDVQWLIDGSDANTANVMRGNAASLTQAFNKQSSLTGTSAIQPRMRFWFNPGNDSDQYIGPAVFAVGLALFPPLLVALAMSREGEQKTILQVYVASIKAHEYLLGKIIAYMMVAVAEWVLTLALAIPMFGIWFKGDPLPFLISSLLYLFCCVSFGAMAGASIPNQAAAIQAVQNVCFLLSFLLSGFVYPISNIPSWLRWISSLVPARYFVEVCRDVFVRGGGWAATWHVPVALALLSTVFFVKAWMSLRKMQVNA
jgi:ABC-2 type transport system permease protein